MQHLHSLGCIHRDLKSGNLLVTQNYHIKVADFGTSKLAASLQANNRGSTSEHVGDGTRTMTKMVGTPLWMAPELLEGKRSYDNKVDVYAYGIVLFEILTQALPWTEIPSKFFMTSLTEAVLGGKRPTVPEEGVVCPDERYVELMEKCWAQQAVDRPAFRDVAGNPLLVFRSRLLSST
jgi:serine/threonine protein kinase